MAEHFSNLVEVLEKTSCSTDDLAKVCRFSALEEYSSVVLDKVEVPGGVIKNLLEICLEGRADDDETIPDLKRARLALRTLVNFCNRSKNIKTGVSAELVLLCRCILRIRELQVEACAFIVAIGSELHREAFLHNDYPNLLADLIALWHVVDDNSWITAFFFSMMETDFGFLSMCFVELPIETFSTLLEITETLLDSSETDVLLKIHTNNVNFCVDLLDRIIDVLGEEKPKILADHLCDILIFLVEIIGHCALRKEAYWHELHQKTQAVVLVIDVLEAALHAQISVEEEEAKNNPRVRYHDRPDIPISCRIPRVTEDIRLSALATSLIAKNEHRAKIKYASVRSIGNLCCDSRLNQIVAGEHGGVIAVLRCTKKRPEDEHFIMQWAIATLRHMIVTCPENQDIVVSIDQNPSNIIDREKLLKELGVEVVKDEVTGKFKVKRM